jgi:hypothetical protein
MSEGCNAQDIVKSCRFLHTFQNTQTKRIFEKLVSALQKTCSFPLTKARRLNISLEAVDDFLRNILGVHCLNLKQMFQRKNLI